jgi:hypothetical protein
MIQDALWLARARRIYGGDTPLAWVERQPQVEEVSELFGIPLSIESNPRKMATILIGAIVRADKERKGPGFRETNPKSFEALQTPCK